jgi:uncharacterized integral membrane protein
MSTLQQEPEQPQPRVERSARERQNLGKFIALGVVVVLIIIFILQNTASVAFTFLFWGFEWPVWAMLVLALLLGFVLGLLVGAILRRRKKKELRRRARAA